MAPRCQPYGKSQPIRSNQNARNQSRRNVDTGAQRNRMQFAS